VLVPQHVLKLCERVVDGGCFDKATVQTGAAFVQRDQAATTAQRLRQLIAGNRAANIEQDAGPISGQGCATARQGDADAESAVLARRLGDRQLEHVKILRHDLEHKREVQHGYY